MRISDWSSDVCSSDLQDPEFNPTLAPPSFWSRLLARADRLISGVREKLPAELRKDDSAAVPATPVPHGGNARDAVVDALLSRLDVSVLGRSHVLSIKMRAAESAKDRKSTRLNSSH